MSEFDKLKDDAEQYAKDHPQQVHEAEQDAEHAVESKVDPGKQGQGSQQDNSGQQGQRDDDDSEPSGSPPDQNHDQDQGQGQGQ